MNKDQNDVVLQSQMDQCETGCILWCKNQGYEQYVFALCFCAEKLADLTNKETLYPDEAISLIIYQMAVYGLSQAWEKSGMQRKQQ